MKELMRLSRDVKILLRSAKVDPYIPAMMSSVLRRNVSSVSMTLSKPKRRKVVTLRLVPGGDLQDDNQVRVIEPVGGSTAAADGLSLPDPITDVAAEVPVVLEQKWFFDVSGRRFPADENGQKIYRSRRPAHILQHEWSGPTSTMTAAQRDDAATDYKRGSKSKSKLSTDAAEIGIAHV